MYNQWLAVIALSCAFGLANSNMNMERKAVAYLSSGEVTGVVLFWEQPDGLHVTGSITGLPPGNYGFHVHELGDTTNCDNAGNHFNPRSVNHGGPNHTVRHVGDLGNVLFVSTGMTATSTLNHLDSVMTLSGRNNILGRTIVLHAQADDLGLGGHATSLTTGNAGARVACAVIGMHAPVEAWDRNSSVAFVPSALLVLVIAVLRFLN